MITPKFRAANRSDVRLFQKEAFKVLKPLRQIEAEFLSLLFDEELKYSYQALFHVYNQKYKERAARFAPKKMLLVDEHYFEDTYKPLEYGNAVQH